MKNIKTGNLDREVDAHPETSGWVLGSFMEKYPEFLSDEVEIKWARHRKGYTKHADQWKEARKTFVIIIEGQFTLSFPEKNQKATLSKLGDYVFYDAGETSHDVEALSDCLMIVIRFPSKK